MQKIAIVSKRSSAHKQAKLIKKVYSCLQKFNKEIYIERKAAESIELKKYKTYKRGQTNVDLVLVMGGDGTILSLVRSMNSTKAKIFGINMGTLGFLSEITPKEINKTLTKIFKGEYQIDTRMMLEIEVIRNKKVVEQFHALNEAVISQSSLARLINLPTKVNDRKLTNYHADGLIIATPTGSTAYSLSAGGPIIYPTLNTIIITPICPHSFTQKPIIVPDDKKIDIKIADKNQKVNITIDGQTSASLEYGDVVRIRRNGQVEFVRLAHENFFKTLREKLDWGKKLEK